MSAKDGFDLRPCIGSAAQILRILRLGPRGGAFGITLLCRRLPLHRLAFVVLPDHPRIHVASRLRHRAVLSPGDEALMLPARHRHRLRPAADPMLSRARFEHQRSPSIMPAGFFLHRLRPRLLTRRFQNPLRLHRQQQRGIPEHQAKQGAFHAFAYAAESVNHAGKPFEARFLKAARSQQMFERSMLAASQRTDSDQIMHLVRACK